MNSLTRLPTFILLFLTGYVVSYQLVTLSASTLSGQTFHAFAPNAFHCDLTAIDVSSLSAQYKSTVSCSTTSSDIPTYYKFDYDRDTRSFTTVSDSFGNQGTCQLARTSSSTLHSFECKVSNTNINNLVTSTTGKCDVERQKCIKVCDKGSKSPACYRNCTALHKKCIERSSVVTTDKPFTGKDCDSERQKCIKVCDKGSKSPACYRNCTALYNKCKDKKAVSTKNFIAATASAGKCDSERQKCIKVCDKGSKSPACYRNCTSLYNECKKPVDAPDTECNTSRQKCIKVCDSGSKSPACYRNCTAIYNQCKMQKGLKQAFITI